MSNRTFPTLTGLLLALCLLSGSAWAAPGDADGCQDHPLLSRMPTYLIERCETHDFDQHTFYNAKREELKIEGKLFEIRYAQQTGKTGVTRLQILRNYDNAISKIGGTQVYRDDDGNGYWRVSRGSKEVWVHINAYIPEGWMLTVVEREAMQQDVTADAAALAGDLQALGHAAVYGILFDTGLAVLKPASAPALAEVAKVMKNNSSLQVSVVGHTDNVGELEANLKLSLARANAVVAALIGEHGIAANRLKGYGVGSLAPVASNGSEAGRAKNRRVELVPR